MPTVEAVPVDPRDQTWEVQSPRYRVYLYDAEGTSDEWELSDVDAEQVLAWAQHTCAGRRYEVYVTVDHDGLGLIQLAQSAPESAKPPTVGVVAPGSEPTLPAGSGVAES